MIITTHSELSLSRILEMRESEFSLTTNETTKKELKQFYDDKIERYFKNHKN